MSDHDFNTPPWIVDLVTSLDRRGIGLDPCSNPNSMVRARKTYDIVSNGLIHPWRGEGLVYVNPPHSQSPYHIEPWIEKAKHEFIDNPIERENNPTGDQLVMLFPAKPDTQWFHSLVPEAIGRCFLRGRPRYWQGGKECPGSGKFPSMLIYVGPQFGRFYNLFEPHGWVL